MSASKRVGAARRSYVLEACESRTLLSATVDAAGVPVGLRARVPVVFSHGPATSPSGATATPAIGGAATPSAVNLTPAQIRGAYGVDAIRFAGIAGDGAGQTIAIVDAFDDPNALSDLNTFDAFYGLPAPAGFNKVDQRGITITATSANNPRPDPQDHWEGEESLDVQWAHVMAPGASIVLVECDSDLGDNLFQGAKTAAGLPGGERRLHELRHRRIPHRDHHRREHLRDAGRAPGRHVRGLGRRQRHLPADHRPDGHARGRPVVPGDVPQRRRRRRHRPDRQRHRLRQRDRLGQRHRQRVQGQ